MTLILPTNSVKDTGYDVANSLRFNSASDDNLSRTPSSASNRKTFTISAWVKRANLGTTQTIIDARIDSNDNCSIFFNDDDNIFIKFKVSPTSQNTSLTTNRKFRDVSAWLNIVLAVDMTQGTDTNRVKFYVNGVQETSFSSATYLTQNTDTTFNNTNEHQLGSRVADTSQDLDGYMAEFVMVDGTALDPTSFGEFDSDTNIWKPINVSGLTFGTNGFYLDFENSGSLGADVSGNGNNFTVNNLTSIDQTTDTCTNNFCTMNPLEYTGATYGTGTLSEGNCKVTIGDNNTNVATFTLNQGKWYWEQKHISSASSQNRIEFGIIQQDVPDYIGGDSLPNTSGKGLIWGGFGDLRGYISTSSFGTFAPNDIIGCALDMDAQTLQFYKNGSAVSTAQDFSGAGWTNVAPTVFCSNNTGNEVGEINFGNPTFSISSGNSDGNGYGNFEYAVPSGYYSLNTKNLAEYG